MNVKSLFREYTLAVWYGSDRRLVRLLPEAIRVVRARLAYGVGPIPFSLFGFARVPTNRWSDYVIKKDHSDVAFEVVNPHDMHRLARNKVLFYEHCRREGLPTIPVVCRIGETPDPLTDMVERVSDPQRLGARFASAPPRLFAKSIDGSFGENAFLIERQGGVFQFAGHTGSAGDLLAHIERQCTAEAGFIIQPQMRPHERMRPLASACGLPTIRVVTAIGADGPEVLYACIKIPVGANITDNFAHGSGGNLLAGIDLQSGMLSPAYGSTRRNWPVMSRVDVHPDSGYRIADSRLPFWHEIVELALRGQRSLPHFKTIGWDIAATTDGVMLVEANSKYSMDILQVAHQRGLKEELGAKINVAID